MVFRAWYHYGRAGQRREYAERSLFLPEHAKLLSMVKRWRKRHHERQQLESLIGGDP